jgi:dihydroorotate dehydrogenase (fumarate)
VYNASGPRTGSVDALQKVGNSKSGAILSKSATLVAQDGNDLPRFLNKIDLGPVCEGSVNSEGLPNYGIDYYLSAEAISSLTVFGKPYIISLSGLSLRDNLEMLTRAYATDGVAAIELNLACPNIPGKPTIAYDFQQMEDVLAAVTAHPSFGKKPLGVKLAPYMDFPHMDHAATLIAKHPGIKFVVTINTIGNALFVDTENECEGFKAKGGMGGLGGGYVKHTALANVRQLSLLLAKKGRADIDVVGVGGVSTGRDAFEMILCGAKVGLSPPFPCVALAARPSSPT